MELLKVQEALKSQLYKSKINFKKCAKDKITKQYIETRIQLLDTKWNELTRNHYEIVKKTECESSTYVKEDIYGDTEEFYLEFKAELKQILDKFQGTFNSTQLSEDTREVSKPSVHLPKINIPQFSGAYTEWLNFKNLFVSLIHNNDSIDDVQKLQYLKSHLGGEAAQLLMHISITGDNYEQCWTMLENRYNNKQYLANHVLKQFFDQRNLLTESSAAIKQLLDSTTNMLHCLFNVGVDTKSWDVIVIYIVSNKLDSESRKHWETRTSTMIDLPTLAEFIEFLESRFRALEYIDTSKSTKPKSNYVNYRVNVHHTNTSSNNLFNNICPFCKDNHKLAFCKQFARESHEARTNFVQTKGLCFNCLGANHSVRICRQTSSCRICNRRHHSLLHPKSVSASSVRSNNAVVDVKSAAPHVKATSSEGQQSTVNLASHFSTNNSVPTHVLLATAIVEAETRQGSTQSLRVLLDQGSEASFITEAAVQLLGLKKAPVKTVISGIGGERSDLASEYTVTVKIHSHLDPNFSIEVHAYVLKNITSLLPSEEIQQYNWPKLAAISLADPEFHTPNRIDILIGAEVYGQILKEGLIQGPPGSPVAQNTVFGWILTGKINSPCSTINCHHVSVQSQDQNDDNALLKQFWEIESVVPKTQKKILSEEESRCEEFYAQTTYRDGTGRYVVNLPFRDEDPKCQYGNSRDIALKRFLFLENKFKKNRELAVCYAEVFQEYINLSHVELVPKKELMSSSAVYLPHHAVAREDKTTTKVRIVFDTSMKTTNSTSLNDDLMIGPILQSPLRHIIMRWRMHPIAICADIIKMYRQVRVSPENIDFQRVLWRNSPESEIEEYRLLRVTFGTASAPYLAVKTLQQVAIDEGDQYPEVFERIKNDFYVDDHDGLSNSTRKYSTLQRLVRVIAYCRRFLKGKKNKEYKRHLEAEEVWEATKVCIRHVQNQEFSEAIKDINGVGHVKARSNLKSLCPVIDEESILRVSGRIERANVEEGFKHPIILPHRSHFTNLIIDEAHKKTLHGGPNLMMNYLRTTYWIISAKTLVKDYVCKSVICKRYSAATQVQLMGQLPACRVNPARPFKFCGVDFAGPISIRTSKGRGHHSYKGYICVFVCMVSKAIHLEAITDLSSDGFIAGFKRFVSRRGYVSDMWSDNGTNFVGASKELKHLVEIEKSTVAAEIQVWMGNQGTTWHFIPPHAPTFGGLWEAGVKSTKYHLRRVIGDSTLTYEELCTVLTQVEACLNSRPLTMLPSNPGELTALTPGHFLIGGPLVAVPERNYETTNVSSLRRWQLTQRMVQGFWRRWSSEYLNQLLQRHRWTKEVPEPNIDDVVLVKEDGLPPARWVMGRVIAKHPGIDKLTRVVTLKQGNGSIIKRSVSKLCILPVTN